MTNFVVVTEVQGGQEDLVLINLDKITRITVDGAGKATVHLTDSSDVTIKETFANVNA